MLNPVLVLLGLTVAISVYAWSNPEVLEKGMLDPYLMSRRNDQWYRFITSGFLHADWGHLLFNMFTFYSFGGVVLTYFGQQFGSSNGTLLFLLLYLGGIVVSDLPTYFRHRQDRSYRSLGASGGVSSVLFAAVLFYPTAGIRMFPLPMAIPGFIWAGLYLLYSYYMGRRRGDNINHDAHFYGALYGVVLTLALVPDAAPVFWQQVLSFRF
ncbi:MAG: rhomboid family intramembrane serine protease [Hymenobacter sp.]|nr:MAG: rhomboid family intramembrane serine protease [Hymenobacter sp.]